MPRVTHVKAARKENPVAQVGESYYWWKFRYGGKHFSKTSPRSSQLCTGRKSEVMAAQEGLSDSLSDACDGDELTAACEECASTFCDLGSEYEQGADNMPESLQQGEQAEAMREMARSLEEQADAFECLDFYDGPKMRDYEWAEDEGDNCEYTTKEEATEAYKTAHDEWLDEKRDEANEVAEAVEFMF
jgi:hypothetical protein